MTLLEIIKLIVTVICLPISLFTLTRLVRNLKLFRANDANIRYLTLDEAPSVSVCIPVRNEDHAIRDCLERVLASNYPKMEVIVLDDGSVDNTDEVVKIFARSGVRFIKGEPLPEGWIGKNKAADQLVAQASGRYILFLSADTDIKPDSISRLIAYAMRHQVDMVSIMPIRFDGFRLSTIFATMRYFWTIIFSNQTRPAYTTAAWLIRRQALIDDGGFERYKSTIIPEANLAGDFAASNSYRFIISDEELGFSYEKRWSSQIETAVRTLWPVNSRSQSKLLFFLLVKLLSIALLINSVVIGQWNILDYLITLVVFISAVTYARFASVAWRKTILLAILVWPFVIIQELFCFLASAWRHKTNNLVWKGRTLTDHID